MAVAGPKTPVEWGAYTVEDFLALADDGMRRELYDGSLHVSPQPTPAHAGVVGRLREVLHRAMPRDLWTLENVAVKVGPARLLVPDLVVVRRDIALDASEDFLLASVVLMVAEVESPSSLAMDRTVKPALYAEAGIPAYLRIVRAGLHGVEVYAYRLGRRHTYRSAVRATGGNVVVLAPPVPASFDPADLVP